MAHPDPDPPPPRRGLTALGILLGIMAVLGAVMLAVVLWVGVPAWFDHAGRQAETGVPDPGPPVQDVAAPQPPGAPGTSREEEAHAQRCRSDVPDDLQPPECRG